jgi:predicted amino acid dehydrogenase
MKHVVIIHLGDGDETSSVSFLGQDVEIRRIGSMGDAERARALIAEFDGRVDAIGLEGLPTQLELGAQHRPHVAGAALPGAAALTPVVDGSGIRAGLERWGIALADRAEPGIWGEKRILMTPGVNHPGMAQALAKHSPHIHYADPVIYFALPAVPGVGSRRTLDQASGPTLDQLTDAPFRRITPQAGQPGVKRDAGPFEWADVLAGDIGAIRRYAPDKLDRKIVAVEWATEADLADLRQRGAMLAVTLMPALDGKDALGRWSAATIEAVLVALRADPTAPLTEDTYLDLLADIEWTPAIRYLQPEQAGVNRFAFVIHPLEVGFIAKDPRFRWTRFLPDTLVETVAAYLPPVYLSRITGAQSPTTGQRVEGYLFSLGATPRQMMNHDPHFTYKLLNKTARMAERKGARIMGLGAFTSVVGDAGITVAHEADIAITSGNSLTVAATLEAAKQAVITMGVQDLTKGRAMVIGATGSIGSVCARLLAQAIYDVVLVSIEPERLIALKRKIQEETPGAQVTIATKAGDLVGGCDLIVTATSAFGQRIMDITRCKPGAVVCDVARPPDINPEEAALRPDVLVIEGGEVLIPGDIDFGYDIGLPPRTSYACLAETALLAMDGRFEDYTLGRDISIERVKEIYRLFKKHEFQIDRLRSFGRYLTEEDIAEKRALAEELRSDPEKFARVKAEAGAQLARIPPRSKGVKTNGRSWTRLAWLGAGLGVIGLAIGLRRRK